MRDNGHTETSEHSVAVAFQRDLYLLWREIAAEDGLPLTTRRYLTRAGLRQIRDELARAELSRAREVDPASEVDDGRTFFLRRMLERLRLLTSEQESARLVAGARLDMARYLAHPLAERLRLCVRLWVAGGWWPDVLDAHAPPPRLLVPAPTRIALARRRLIETLLALPTGSEVQVLIGPAVAPVTPRAPTAEYPPQHTRLTPLPEEAESVRAALLGPLQWMGYVEVLPAGNVHSGGGTKIPHTLQVRLLPALDVLRVPAEEPGPGTGSLEDSRESAAEMPRAEGVDLAGSIEADAFGGVTDAGEQLGRVIVQPNLDVLAYPPLTAPILFTLDTLAERKTLDGVARYRLSRDALANAHQQGWQTQQIRTRLERLAAAPLPPNVAVTLDDWTRALDRVHLTRSVGIVQVRDTALLERLYGNPALAPLLGRRLSPSAAVVPSEHLAAVRRWLIEQGEIPAVRRAPTPAPPSAPTTGPLSQAASIDKLSPPTYN